jgi:hypothetical protein
LAADRIGHPNVVKIPPVALLFDLHPVIRWQKLTPLIQAINRPDFIWNLTLVGKRTARNWRKQELPIIFIAQIRWPGLTKAGPTLGGYMKKLSSSPDSQYIHRFLTDC